MSRRKPVRIIKKYLNRRLYDTYGSCYITQDKVKELVLAGDAFKVVNAKSGEDITRTVLLHIILDEEIMGVPLFTEEVLRSILLFSGTGTRRMFSGFLEQSLPMLFKSHENMANGYDDDDDNRISENMASMHGMLLGNAFQEYINRSMNLVLKTNQKLAAHAAQMVAGRSKDSKEKG